MASFSITVTGGAEIVKALARIERSVARGLARGAVGEGANRIRDAARGQARARGLGMSGAVVTASGNKITRHGHIPLAIHAGVGRPRGSKQLGFVAVDASISESGRGKSKSKTPHWIMVEFGSVNNIMSPFMRPGLEIGGPGAVKAMVDVLSRGIKRYNKPGG